MLNVKSEAENQVVLGTLGIVELRHAARIATNVSQDVAIRRIRSASLTSPVNIFKSDQINTQNPGKLNTCKASLQPDLFAGFGGGTRS